MKLIKKAKKGFTIVELVIVIGVIGILSAILIPTFANLTSRAEETALQADLSGGYSAYASEAADHIVDGYKDSGDHDIAIEFLSQEAVVLKYKDAKYQLNSGTGKWETSTDATTTLVVTVPAVSPSAKTAEQLSTFSKVTVYVKTVA